MTLSDLNGELHHVRYAVSMAKIKSRFGTGIDLAVAHDVDALRDAMENHIRAKGQWATFASDQTMGNLVGTWSRMSRIMEEMEKRYA